MAKTLQWMEGGLRGELLLQYSFFFKVIRSICENYSKEDCAVGIFQKADLMR